MNTRNESYPHVVKITWKEEEKDTRHWETVLPWINEQIGGPGTHWIASHETKDGNPTAIANKHVSTFRFKEKEDAVTFKVMWG